MIEFIELLKKKDLKQERLFQELPYRDGNYNQNVSRFFNKRYLPSLELKTDKKNFHSFRYTVSDHLKQKGIEPHFINELLGHSTVETLTLRDMERDTILTYFIISVLRKYSMKPHIKEELISSH